MVHGNVIKSTPLFRLSHRINCHHVFHTLCSLNACAKSLRKTSSSVTIYSCVGHNGVIETIHLDRHNNCEGITITIWDHQSPTFDASSCMLQLFQKLPQKLSKTQRVNRTATLGTVELLAFVCAKYLQWNPNWNFSPHFHFNIKVCLER